MRDDTPDRLRQRHREPQSRLASLDAFRGFVMLWLIGGHALLMAICPLMPKPIGEFLASQWTHSSWEGLRFYDLIWPCFMLMVGASVPFSWANRSREESYSRFLLHALKRATVLFLLGSLRASG